MVTKRAWIPAKGTYSVGTADDPYDLIVGQLYHESRQPINIPADYIEVPEKARPAIEFLIDNEQLQAFLKVVRAF
jgi:P-type Na+/K+ transporter